MTQVGPLSTHWNDKGSEIRDWIAGREGVVREKCLSGPLSATSGAKEPVWRRDDIVTKLVR